MPEAAHESPSGSFPRDSIRYTRWGSWNRALTLTLISQTSLGFLGIFARFCGRHKHKHKGPRAMERCEPVVQEVLEPSEGLQRRAMRLLHAVEGEFEDEDGDTANGFILADPVPSTFIDSLCEVGSRFESCKSSLDGDSQAPQHSGRKHKLDADEVFLEAHSSCSSGGSSSSGEGWFLCLLCNRKVLLEDLALPGLTCSCLFCKPCFGSYVRSIIRSLPTTSHAKVAVRAKNSADAAKYSRTNSSKFVDLTSGSSSSSSSSSSRDYVRCPSGHCNNRFPLTELQVLDPESFSEWEEAVSKSLLQNNDVFVKCPRCNVTIEKVKSDLPPGLAPCGVPELDKTVPFTELDPEGNALSRRAMFHKAVNRFRCTACDSNFCAGCLVSPYHLGKTCEEYDAVLKAEKCRYCEKPILDAFKQVTEGMSVRKLRQHLEREDVDTTWCMEKSELIAVWKLRGRVCSEKDCRDRLAASCTRVLDCGHACGGVQSERSCLPCLEDGCRREHNPSADDLCAICLEKMRLGPCIQLQCGHIVHLLCAKAQIAGGWPGPQISFGYLCCPQCKKLMEHSSLQACMRESLSMMNKIKAKAVKRMEMDGIYKKVSSRGDSELAAELAKYQFYLCSKCQTPYFGGKRECQAANIEGARDYNPAELVCGGCIAGEGGKCKRGHGSEYVEFKCYYCCNPATYFCWGKTHFCEPCHASRRSVTPCKGPRVCPFKGKHAPNGQQWCAGCSMCRCQEQ